MAPDARPARGNQLLAALPPAEYDRLAAQLHPVTLAQKKVLAEPEETLRFVYFPMRPCVVSMLSFVDNGKGAEVATVGDEGFLGVPAFLGAEVSSNQAVVQIAGDALRIKVGPFRDVLAAGGALAARLGRYTHALLTMMGQSAACYGVHSVEERLCRWLLTIHDRVGTDVLPLTQQFLAQMLAVRRPSVTVVAGMLQKAGLITHRRGRVTVRDRAGLEKASCDCYAVVRREFDRATA